MIHHCCGEADDDSFMRVFYEGGHLGLRAVVQALEAEGLVFSYDRPAEERGAGEQLFHVVVHIGQNLAENAEDTVDVAVLTYLARKAIARVKDRWPDVKAEVEGEAEDE